MKQKRIHYMTLLELVISLALTMIILATLSFFYREVDLLDTETEKKQRDMFQLRYLENRLANILPRAISEYDTEKDFYFFTSPDPANLFKQDSKSLIFTYDRKIDLDKPFSTHTLGRLYLDKEGRLTLGIWPSKNRWDLAKGTLPPMKKEILLENVEDLSFEFYAAPAKNRSRLRGKNQKEIKHPVEPEKDSWLKEWLNDYLQLPAIIKVKVKQNNKWIVFAFPLPNIQDAIVYDQ